MGKKGQLVLKPIVELLVAAAVVGSFFFIAHGFATKDFNGRALLSRELALVADALYAVPGNAWLVYPANVSHYSVQLEKGAVTVLPPPFPFSSSFPFVGIINGSTVSSHPLALARDGDALLFGQPPLEKMRCGQEYDVKQKQLVMKLTNETEILAQSFGLRCSPDFYCSRESTVTENEDTLFIKIVPSWRTGIAARFYEQGQSVQESRWLACAFLNSMIERTTTSVYLLPTDDPELEKRGDRVALLIEVGGTPYSDIVRALSSVIR